MSEEKKCFENAFEDYKSAFECFKQRFLVDKRSIFRLNDTHAVLTSGGVTYLIDNFINKGYSGNTKSVEKFCHQLTGKKYDPKNPKIEFDQNDSDMDNKKQAIEILATAIWLWKLAPKNANKLSRINAVNEIYALVFDKLEDKMNNPFFGDKIEGFASPGMRYNMNKANELAYIVLFFKNCLDKITCAEITVRCLTSNCDSSGKNANKKDCVSINATHDYSYTDKATLPEQSTEISKSQQYEESVAVYNALLHLLDPDKYEPILSKNYKEMILKAFGDKVDDCEPKPQTLDEKLLCIKANLQCDSFYDEDIIEQWLPTVLPAKNVIYYGAPGTGKTFELMKMIKAKAQLQDKDCPEKYYKVVQFHPSYNYEDFIDGVKPVNVKSNDSNGTIQLELQNGVFKTMCREAFKELEDAKKNNRQAKKFYFIADEINRAELSRVFGELLVCLEEDKRLRFINGTLEGLLVQTQNFSLWKPEHAVVNLNNTNCRNGLYFGVPENIYFLGTMNDVDKSIDSFDLALRRRFKWIHKGCNYDVITNFLEEKNVSDDDMAGYINDGKNKNQKGRCVLLNEYINLKLGLGKSYELGHSYFMKLNIYSNGSIPKNAYTNLFDFEIAPLLAEYLRAEFDTKGIETHIKKMKAIFVNGDENSEVKDGDDNNS